MKNIEQLDEAIIEEALKECLITIEEARVMSEVYLNKYSFSPIQSTAPHPKSSSRPHSFS